MPRPGAELASIDVEAMIVGPLIAVVNAQAQSAMSPMRMSGSPYYLTAKVVLFGGAGSIP